MKIIEAKINPLIKESYLQYNINEAKYVVMMALSFIGAKGCWVCHLTNSGRTTVSAFLIDSSSLIYLRRIQLEY